MLHANGKYIFVQFLWNVVLFKTTYKFLTFSIYKSIIFYFKSLRKYQEINYNLFFIYNIRLYDENSNLSSNDNRFYLFSKYATKNYIFNISIYIDITKSSHHAVNDGFIFSSKKIKLYNLLK